MEEYSWVKDVEDTSMTLKSIYDDNFKVLIHDQGKFVFQLSISFPELSDRKNTPTTMTLEVLSTANNPTPEFKIVQQPQSLVVTQPDIPRFIMEVVKQKMPLNKIMKSRPKKKLLALTGNNINTGNTNENGSTSELKGEPSFSLNEMTQFIIDEVKGEMAQLIKAISESFNSGLNVGLARKEDKFYSRNDQSTHKSSKNINDIPLNPILSENIEGNISKNKDPLIDDKNNVSNSRKYMDVNSYGKKKNDNGNLTSTNNNIRHNKNSGNLNHLCDIIEEEERSDREEYYDEGSIDLGLNNYPGNKLLDNIIDKHSDKLGDKGNNNYASQRFGDLDKVRFNYLVNKSENDICKEIGKEHNDMMERVKKYSDIYTSFLNACSLLSPEFNDGEKENESPYFLKSAPGSPNELNALGTQCNVPSDNIYYNINYNKDNDDEVKSFENLEKKPEMIKQMIKEDVHNVTDMLSDIKIEELDGSSNISYDEQKNSEQEVYNNSTAIINTSYNDSQRVTDSKLVIVQESDEEIKNNDKNHENSVCKIQNEKEIKENKQCTFIRSMNDNGKIQERLENKNDKFCRISAVFNVTNNPKAIQPILNFLSSGLNPEMFSKKIAEYFIDKKKEKLKDLLLEYAIYKALGGFDTDSFPNSNVEPTFFQNFSSYLRIVKAFKRAQLLNEDVESDIIKVRKILKKKALKIIETIKTKDAINGKKEFNKTVQFGPNTNKCYTFDISPDSDEDARAILDFLKLPPAPQSTPQLPKFLLKASEPITTYTNNNNNDNNNNILNKNTLVESPKMLQTNTIDTAEQNYYLRQNSVDFVEGGIQNERSESMNVISSIQNQPSRFADEYEVISVLGRGGFGEVLKVRSKIDGNYYALKKVKINNLSLNDEEEVYGDSMSFTEIQREVLSLSLIKSKNVVRYYTAWIEQNVVVTTLQDSSLLSTSEVSSSYCLGCKPNIQHVGEEETQDETTTILDFESSEGINNRYYHNSNNNNDNNSNNIDDEEYQYYGTNKNKHLRYKLEPPDETEETEFNNSRPPLNGGSIQLIKSKNCDTIHPINENEVIQDTNNQYEGTDKDSYDYVYEYDDEEETNNSEDSPEFNGPFKVIQNSGTCASPKSKEGYGDNFQIESDMVEEEGEYEISIGDPNLWDEVESDKKFNHEESSRTEQQSIQKNDKERSYSYNDKRIVKPYYTLFILMEICTNGTLRTHLPLITDYIVYKIIIQLLIGLSDIHSKHIIHRDIKPENIFMDDGMNALIGDFGFAYKYSNNVETLGRALYPGNIEDGDLSTVTGALTSTDDQRELSFYSDSKLTGIKTIKGENDMYSPISFLGSGIYMAPEIGQNSYNEKVDIYALGIVIFEILYPFRNEDEREKVLTRLVSYTDPNKRFPHDWKITHPFFAQLINQMINRNPKKRPAASEILKMILSSNLGFAYAKVEEYIRARERTIDKQKYDELSLSNIGDVVSYLMQSIGLKVRSPPEIFRLRKMGRLTVTDIKNNSTIMNESLLTYPEVNTIIDPRKYEKFSKVIKKAVKRYNFVKVNPSSVFVYNIEGKGIDCSNKNNAGNQDDNDRIKLDIQKQNGGSIRGILDPGQSNTFSKRNPRSKHRRCITNISDDNNDFKNNTKSRDNLLLKKETEAYDTDLHDEKKTNNGNKGTSKTKTKPKKDGDISPRENKVSYNNEKIEKKNIETAMMEFNRFCSPLPYLSTDGRCVIQVYRHFDLALLNISPKFIYPNNDMLSPSPHLELFRPPFMSDAQTRRQVTLDQKNFMYESEDKISLITANRIGNELNEFVQIFRSILLSLVEKFIIGHSKEKKEAFYNSTLIVGKNSITREFLQRVGMFRRNKLISLDCDRLFQYRNNLANVPFHQNNKKITNTKITNQSIGVYNQRDFKTILQHEKIKLDDIFEIENLIRQEPKMVGTNEGKYSSSYICTNLPFLNNIVYSFVPIHDDNNTVVSLYYRYTNMSPYSSLAPSSTSKFLSNCDYWFQLVDRTGKVLTDFNSISVGEMKLSILQCNINTFLNTIPIRAPNCYNITSSFSNETIYNFVVQALWESLTNNGIKANMCYYRDEIKRIEEDDTTNNFANTHERRWNQDNYKAYLDQKQSNRIIIHKVLVYDKNTRYVQTKKYSSSKINKGIYPELNEREMRDWNVNKGMAKKLVRKERREQNKRKNDDEDIIKFKNDIHGGHVFIDSMVCEFEGIIYKTFRDLLEALKKHDQEDHGE